MKQIYTAEISEAFAKRVSEMSITDLVEKGRAAKVEDTGRFKVVISTEDQDRAGEIVRQAGWDFSNYKNNPIVLWGHDYYSLPIGVTENIYVEGTKTVAEGFLPGHINPLAQQVRKLYELGLTKGKGVGCTTSVGFIVKEFDKQDMSVITKAELLEFSFVPVPANQGVGPAKGVQLTFDMAKELGLDTALLVTKGLEFVEKSKKKGGELGDACEGDDGTPGVLATDPNDADGPLVCVPQDEDKSKTAEEIAAEKEKGQVGAELADQEKYKAKWEKLNVVWNVFDAFIGVYLDEKTDVADFEKLLDETLTLMKNPNAEKAMLGEYIKANTVEGIYKAGAAISAANKDKLEKCYQLMMDARATHTKAIDIIKGMHGAINDAEGEDGGGDVTTDAVVAPKERSTHLVAPTEAEEIASHLFAKGLLRELVTVANEGLARLNKTDSGSPIRRPRN